MNASSMDSKAGGTSEATTRVMELSAVDLIDSNAVESLQPPGVQQDPPRALESQESAQHQSDWALWLSVCFIAYAVLSLFFGPKLAFILMLLLPISLLIA